MRIFALAEHFLHSSLTSTRPWRGSAVSFGSNLDPPTKLTLERADPSLPSHPSHELAKTMLPHGSGGMVSFGMKPGNGDAGTVGREVIDHMKLAKHCANVGVSATLSSQAI